MRTNITNRMMIGASLLIMTFSFAPETNAQTCATVPSCEELGYTETWCDTGGEEVALKCPFDQTKMFCANQKRECKNGYIVYDDFSCSHDVRPGKTAIGVFFVQNMHSGSGRSIVTLDDVNSITQCYTTMWNGQRFGSYSKDNTGGYQYGTGTMWLGFIAVDDEDRQAFINGFERLGKQAPSGSYDYSYMEYNGKCCVFDTTNGSSSCQSSCKNRARCELSLYIY